MCELVGATIGQYIIQSRLARGGMSDVYLACDMEKDKRVAIKLVHHRDEENCKRFRREVRAVAHLHHEHILPILDCGEYGPWYYMVTPYIEHGTLHERLAKGPLSLEEAGDILSQLAGALQCAHDHGVVHRDIKPSNVLLQDGKHVYLADFGLVKGIKEDHTVTQTGYIVGTPEYMAPELVDQPATVSSDVYALGVLLYQMTTGRVPFKGNTPVATVWKHLRDEPESPSKLNPVVTSRVERVILRALAKEPWQRLQTTCELAQAFHHALTSSDSMNATLAVDACRPLVSRLSTPPAAPKRRRQLFLGAVAALLVGMLYVGPVLLISFTSSIQGEHAGLLDAGITVRSVPTSTPTATPTSKTLSPSSPKQANPIDKEKKQGHDNSHGYDNHDHQKGKQNY
ncbi:MAG: serine/threonine protein kinase [Ktedonobacteraceae bacterium]|nr:serine/threonine protein kinase [Ktedonobacteraceae bacterium]